MDISRSHITPFQPKKYHYQFIGVIITTVTLALIALPAQASFAQSLSDVVKNTADTLGIPSINYNEDPAPKFLNIIASVINFLLSLAAVLALAAVIWGGIMYVISLGDENRSAKAKRIILFAIGGLLVIGLSFFIILTIQLWF